MYLLEHILNKCTMALANILFPSRYFEMATAEDARSRCEIQYS